MPGIRSRILIDSNELLRSEKSNLSWNEIDFLSANEPVRIVPSVNISTILLIRADVGPFKSGIPAQVPLWTALHLKRIRLCRVLMPDWMELNTLERMLEREKSSPSLTRMPSPHFMEVAIILFANCLDDINNADKIRTAVKDIWDVRESKIKTSMANFVDLGADTAKIDNVTQMEVCNIRQFFSLATQNAFRLQKALKITALHKEALDVQARSGDPTNNDSEATSFSYSETF